MERNYGWNYWNIIITIIIKDRINQLALKHQQKFTKREMGYITPYFKTTSDLCLLW